MSYKILLVDDDNEFTAYMQELLSARGYRVVVENNAGRALSAARNHLPDLLLLDINMPVSGSEIAAKIKEDGQLTHIPIIFITGLVSPEEEGEFRRNTSDYPFFSKPFKIEDLFRCVEHALAHAHANGRIRS